MAQPNQLSPREEDVVRLLLEGKSNKLIASSLGISGSTVEFHLKNIYTKFEVRSRTELILKLGNSIGAGKGELRQSIVADKGEFAENGDRPNSENWSTSSRETISTFSEESTMESLMGSEAHNGADTLTFTESIRVCFAKYADFNGQASRAEFWWFMLFVTLVAAALTYLDQRLVSIFLIATLLPTLAAGARRLHEADKSGWWQLFLLVPAAGILLVAILWMLPPAEQATTD